MTVNASASASDRARLRATVAAQLGRPTKLLAFEPELEELYERSTHAARVRHLVQSGVLGIVLSSAFLVTDAQLIPDVFALSLAIHIGGSLLYLGVTSATPRLAAGRREAAQAITLTLIALGVVWLITVSHAPYRGYASITYVMLLNYVNLVIRLTFRWCLVFSTMVVLAVLASVLAQSATAAWALPAGVPLLVALSTIIAACFTVQTNRALEWGARTGYLLTLEQRLASEQLTEYNSALNALSATDWLTGISNRRGLELHLARSWARCADRGQTLALLMIDVDHFKPFNDYRGHPAGDRCLAALSALIGRELRQDYDFLARYGGEEFAVVLLNTTLEAACQAGERIRRAVESAALPHGAPGAGPVITVSIGVEASRAHHGEAPEHIIAGADRALYRSKQGGRNRVSPPALAYAPAAEKQFSPG